MPAVFPTGRPSRFTPEQRAALAELWRAHPTATRRQLADLAAAALGVPCHPSTVARYRPAGCGPRPLAPAPAPAEPPAAGDAGRAAHLSPEQIGVIRGLWQVDPKAAAWKIALRAAEALGRSIHLSTALQYRPAGCGIAASPRFVPPPPRPEAGPRAARGLPYASPLADLILESHRVRTRLGIARKGVAR
jgi:hypothetical protein